MFLVVNFSDLPRSFISSNIRVFGFLNYNSTRYGVTPPTTQTHTHTHTRAHTHTLYVHKPHFLLLLDISEIFIFILQAGWKENHGTFISELKNLEATGLSTFGQSLKEAFDILNIHRLHTSIDHYGQVHLLCVC